MKVLVSITEEDIKLNKHSATSCPVARAVKRVLKHKWKSKVFAGPAKCRLLDGYVVICETKKYQNFIKKYDLKIGTTKPTTFLMNIPDKYLKT